MFYLKRSIRNVKRSKNNFGGQQNVRCLHNFNAANVRGICCWAETRIVVPIPMWLIRFGVNKFGRHVNVTFAAPRRDLKDLLLHP